MPETTETIFERPTTTREELIAALEALPSGTPILGYAVMLNEDGNVCAEGYVNIDGLHFLDGENIAATIELRDDYDTRQW